MRPSAAWRRRLRKMGEFAAMFGALAVTDRLTTGGTGFAAVQPNPYCLPILVLALAYGTEAGLAAAIVASWIWLAHASSVVTPGGDYLDRLLQLSLTPLVWFLVAALVGEVTNLRLRRMERCDREAGRATRNVERLSDAYRDLAASNRALQVQIAVEEGTIGRVVALAATLGSGDAAARRRTIGELIALAARTQDYSIYTIGRGGIVRLWLRGRSIAARPDILPEPLMRSLCQGGEVLHVARPDDRALLADIGVAAVPLVGTGASSATGCLVLHDLPFSTLNAQAVAEIAEIGAWLPQLMPGGEGPAAGFVRHAGGAV